MAASPGAVTAGELKSVNPETLEVVGSVRAKGPEVIPEAVTETRLAQEGWARLSREERRRLPAAVAPGHVLAC